MDLFPKTGQEFFMNEFPDTICASVHFLMPMCSKTLSIFFSYRVFKLSLNRDKNDWNQSSVNENMQYCTLIKHKAKQFNLLMLIKRNAVSRHERA